jgi:hypothetical protein
MRDWVDGYNQVFQQGGRKVPYYDFGDAQACYPYNHPKVGANGELEAKCDNGWRADDVWYKSAGAPPAWALPQIYFGSPTNAGQWQKLSLYAVAQHRYRIFFAGVTAQHTACTERKNDGHDEEGCYHNRKPSNGTFTNTPEEAWQQLHYKLNNNDPAFHGSQGDPNCKSANQGCHRTEQLMLDYATDFSWSLR